MVKPLLAALLLIGSGCTQAPDPAATVEFQNAAVVHGGALADDLTLTGRVVDAANVLRSETESTLSTRSAALEKATSDQLVVATVTQLDGKSIADFARDLGNRWRLGQATKDNGVLVVFAPDQRQVQIAVGTGLEGLLTDQEAAKVVNAMLVRFRQGDFDRGLLEGSSMIDTRLRSDLRRPQPKPAKEKAAA